MPLAIKELAKISKYFVLQEVKVPDGYRAETPNINLYIHEGNKGASLLLVDDMWGSGAYAVPSVTIRATADVYKFNRANPTQPGEEIGENDLEKGTIFAVAFGYDESKGTAGVGDEANWRPISGNQLNGWTVHNSKADIMDNIIEAANATPNVFTLLSDGSTGCRVDEVPGDSKLYYYMLEDGQKNQSRYTYSFYFTEGTLEDATAANTHRLYGDEFLREFSAHIYVPDMINTLYVRKTDAYGNALPGAAFALYRKEATDDGSVNWQPYYTATTEANGYTAFPNATSNNSNGKAILEKGVYRLVETDAPAGYVINKAASEFDSTLPEPGGIPVIVNERGVFVDAGTAGDGITVRKQTGRIVRTMLHFATNDHLNRTLKDIWAFSQTTPNYPEDIGDVPNVVWQNGDGELHLTYDGKATLEGNVQDYVPTVANAPVYLETDTGYLRLRIRQEYGIGDAARLKEDLRDTDLTQLFSIATTVVVANDHDPLDPTRTSLTVSKQVTGENADTQRPFAFTVTLEDASVSGTYGGMTFTNGRATFMLKHGESLTAVGLPVTGYTVEEVPADGYMTTAENAKGTLAKGAPVTASFENEKVELTALTVSKLVTGENADTQRPFTFTVTLDDRSISGTYEDMTFNAGVATFTLKHAESLTAIGLPETGYTVEETPVDGYKVKAENAKGKLVKGAPVVALFQNERTQPGTTGSVPPSSTPEPTAVPPKTGDNSHAMLWLALALTAAGCLAGIALYTTKRKSEK